MSEQHTTMTESNRRNARRSTGPRTQAGKSVSSRNAVKHGAYSEALTMLMESPDGFEAIKTGLVDTLHPSGPLEVGLVDRMASLWWRAERAKTTANQALWMAAKKNTLEDHLPFDRADELMYFEADLCRLAGAWDHDTQERLLRHELTLVRSFFRLLHELERIQAQRKGLAIPPPVAVDVNISGAGD